MWSQLSTCYGTLQIILLFFKFFFIIVIIIIITVLPATYHKWTPCLNLRQRPELDLPTPEGWKAELIWLLYVSDVWNFADEFLVFLLSVPPYEFIQRHAYLEFVFILPSSDTT